MYSGRNVSYEEKYMFVFHRMPNIQMLPLGRTATNQFNKHGYLNSGVAAHR